MKVLWIPQLPVGSNGWEGSRHYHLLRHLGRTHQVHVISWRHVKRLTELMKLGTCVRNGQAPLFQHSIYLAPGLYRIFSKSYPKRYHVAFNQHLFRHSVTAIADAVDPDVCVYSSSHHATGFPPVLPTPTVFDYLDYSPPWVEDFYMSHATAVAAVSLPLAAVGRRFHKPAYWIPNGVDLEKYRSVNRQEAKQKLGLSGHSVVSLIGLTCSPRLYFLDAIAEVQKERPDVMFLTAGSGPSLDPIVKRARELGLRNFRDVGWVPNTDVHWYFAATDVGLYPGDDVAYYRLASPLKIIEYAAAGAQVVTSPVDLFATGWPPVRTACADAPSFKRAILESLDEPRPAPDLTSYDWSALATRFGEIFDSIVP